MIGGLITSTALSLLVVAATSQTTAFRSALKCRSQQTCRKCELIYRGKADIKLLGRLRPSSCVMTPPVLP